MKKCTKCGQIKERGEFYKNKKHSTGLTSSCKDCHKENYVKKNYQDKNCDVCGVTFSPRQVGARFCSRKCSRASAEKNRVRDSSSGHTEKHGTCQWCGKPYSRNQRTAGKTCGRECASKLRCIGKFTKVYFPECKICLSPIRASKNPTIQENHCGKCKERYGYNIYAVTSGKTETNCTNCGVLFSRVPPNKSKCCSNDCELKLSSTSKRKAKAKRKAVKRKCNGGESFDPFEIFERDKWTCQICGIETPKSKRGLNLDDSPELDHIHPISKGGLHTRKNTQCLCRSCNGKKSDKIIVNVSPLNS